MSTAEIILSQADITTLRAFSIAFKSARKVASNEDPTKSKQAWQRLTDLVTYISGFFDAKGVTEVNRPPLGLERAFPIEVSLNKDDLLNKLEADIDGVLVKSLEPNSRGGVLWSPAVFWTGVAVLTALAADIVDDQ